MFNKYKYGLSISKFRKRLEKLIGNKPIIINFDDYYKNFNLTWLFDSFNVRLNINKDNKEFYLIYINREEPRYYNSFEIFLEDHLNILDAIDLILKSTNSFYIVYNFYKIILKEQLGEFTRIYLTKHLVCFECNYYDYFDEVFNNINWSNYKKNLDLIKSKYNIQYDDQYKCVEITLPNRTYKLSWWDFEDRISIKYYRNNIRYSVDVFYKPNTTLTGWQIINSLILGDWHEWLIIKCIRQDVRRVEFLSDNKLRFHTYNKKTIKIDIDKII